MMLLHSGGESGELKTDHAYFTINTLLSYLFTSDYVSKNFTHVGFSDLHLGAAKGLELPFITLC